MKLPGIIASVLSSIVVAAVCMSAAAWIRLADQTAATERELPAVVERQLALTRDALQSEIQATRADALKAVARLQATADRRLAAMQGDAVKAVETASARIDSRLGEVTATVAGIRADAAPVFSESAATVKDARDTMDALYPDTLALMDTTAVAARSVSETMGAVEKAAPRIAEGTARNAENIAGITHDAHVLTERLTKPQSIKARIWEGVKVAAIVARFF